MSAALARAFDDDPVTRWVFPEKRYDERLRNWFALNLVKLNLRHRLVFTTEGYQGGAIWMPPETWALHVRDLLRVLPGNIRALGAKLPSAFITLLDIEKRHPKAPHYYLATLGTEPAWQGKGVGSALLQPVLARCDAEGVPAYLESSKERNVPFYARHGFEVTERMELRGGGPPLWLMWREPRPPSMP